MEFVDNPRVRPNTVEKRSYQTELARACLRENSLVVIPTGLGKTVVAMLVATEILNKGKKVLMLAPTKPLVEQHCDTFSSLLNDTSIGVMNGNMPFEKRIEVFHGNELIISTPQVVDNDLEKGRYDLDKLGLIIFDEAHRAVGSYAYVRVASMSKCPVMGLTASPSSSKAKIEEVCNNLSITNVVMKTEDDPDVSPYVYDTHVKNIYVNMPDELLEVVKLLYEIMKPHLEDLRRFGMIGNIDPSVKQLIVLGNSLQLRLKREKDSPYLFRALIAQSACMKLMHAMDLAETQGMTALRSYMVKLDEESQQERGGRTAKEIRNTDQYKKCWQIVKNTKVEHPKISRVMSLVSKTINSGTDSKVLVFTQYRDTCELLVQKISGIDNAKPVKLIGQSNGGLKQKEQIALLDGFRKGESNVLVATSVGEEGLDIANTDVVIFYEPVPSEIRSIQRRGRTGRKNDGDVYVLIANGTKDEMYEASSKKKEEAMKATLAKINSSLKSKLRPKRGQMHFE